MSRVALIEDHARLAQMVRKALSAAGIETDVFSNISQAEYGVRRAEYGVLIVDRGLPDGDGLTLLRNLRSAGFMTPCLMLTARDALHDRVDGLESGADDYVTKPFAMSELVARVRTLMRRPPTLTSLSASFGDVRIDPQHRTLHCGEHSTQLAPAELQIILMLVKSNAGTVRHAELEHAAWGMTEAVTPNALEVTVHRLRKKLTAVGAAVRIINVRGIGFTLHDRPVTLDKSDR
ncbi:response regulator transcription factor [Paraburkholderia silvatlantica]|uniref:DNA-binding response OmpR family regulator n=1 Tax=Paraburkholderia silvatlantica TaxID=321895 RepID=A0A2U1AA46_9BURK|nr:response regulator transcription factor [Paraburkholderia silvatlantica]MBB2928056.1 DNA-binding response OmpR family regulator [Paraburkholderia silvatlantica]PVY31022.1 winged helix family two component transcriptional regulator [Paraburkholderia silvatlantica]PXW37158.1 winged helix family two component transcriptional regulator [Paraburkholderia silvatlantica]PYE19702.1 winged helix family two component transcriptional regulator [Paraburkholderia silvatlantica]TDQ89465.1 winged helix fa